MSLGGGCRQEIMWKELGQSGRVSSETEKKMLLLSVTAICTWGRIFLLGLALANCSGNLLVRSRS